MWVTASEHLLGQARRSSHPLAVYIIVPNEMAERHGHTPSPPFHECGEDQVFLQGDVPEDTSIEQAYAILVDSTLLQLRSAT